MNCSPNFPTISQLKGKKISKNSLNRQIKEGFLKLWKNQMKQYSEGKLCTYTTFKVHFGFENYLSVIGNFEHRRFKPATQGVLLFFLCVCTYLPYVFSLEVGKDFHEALVI
jgi:hypothetical protein